MAPPVRVIKERVMYSTRMSENMNLHRDVLYFPVFDRFICVMKSSTQRSETANIPGVQRKSTMKHLFN